MFFYESVVEWSVMFEVGYDFGEIGKVDGFFLDRCCG